MRIEKYNKIFSSDDYLNDKWITPIFEEMLTSTERLFDSDEENYIIGRACYGYPIWIWTRETISKDKIVELVRVFQEKYLSDKHSSCTCKREIFDELQKYLPNVLFDYEILFLTCTELREMPKTYGFMDRPSYNDETVLANCWIHLQEESNHKIIPYMDALDKAAEWIADENFYVWRNGEGRTVSIAGFDKISGIISNVFTEKEDRRKGYCSNLIYELSKKMLDNNIIPCLYTESDNSLSNNIYKNMGYSCKERLVTFHIKDDSVNDVEILM